MFAPRPKDRSTAPIVLIVLAIIITVFSGGSMMMLPIAALLFGTGILLLNSLHSSWRHQPGPLQPGKHFMNVVFERNARGRRRGKLLGNERPDHH
jgi:hypothetical protein